MPLLTFPSSRPCALLPAALLLGAGLLCFIPPRFLAEGPSLPAMPAAVAQALSPRESFSFQMRDFPVQHQGLNTLNVSVRYDYQADLPAADYPDFRAVEGTCEEFLVRYPDADAYWEIVNKELTARLLAAFPALSSVTVEIQVSATTAIPFVRASTVTRIRR